MKEKLRLKGWVKTLLIILFIYLVFVAYICFVSNRVQNLNENSYTKSGHNNSIVLVK